MNPKISLCYTTVRPHLVCEVVTKWITTAHTHAVEICLAVDQPISPGESCMVDYLTVIGHPPFNAVRGWNAAARQSSGDILIAISDDIEPPENWDAKIVEAFGNRIGYEHVLLVEDGLTSHRHGKYIATIPILTRKRYLQAGNLFHEAYESMWCDDEFTQHAIKDGVEIDAKHLVFTHNHWIAGRRKKDAHDKLHASNERYERGKALFLERQAKGFPK